MTVTQSTTNHLPYARLQVRYAPIVSVLRPESELDGLMVVEENEATVEGLLKYTEYQVR